ncbi:MAG: segregation and condensation protein A [Gammaproteobacteria bacterium]|nr:MAG: segregation and condensation protein A [Gammaproteobacteria bacterium]
MSDESKKEREILMVMRKVLAQIIKDTTPPSRAMKHPLSDDTIQDIRACLGLISARERELADAAGIPVEKPYYADEKPAAEVVSIDSIPRPGKERD